MTDASASTPRVARPTWVGGGAALIASALLAIAGPNVGSFAGGRVLALAGPACWCARMCLLALGHDSVVARRPLGVATMIGFGVLPLLTDLVWVLAPIGTFAADDPGLAMLASIGYAQTVVTVMVGIVATVQIARGGMVPTSMRWWPLVGLGVVVVVQLVAQAAYVVTVSGRAPSDAVSQATAGILGGVGGLIGVAVPVVLGVAAIVAGFQPRRGEASAVAAVPIHPPG